MKKIAFIFPGQGSQYVGMGQDVLENNHFANDIINKAETIIGIDLKELCLQGPAEELSLTSNTQPAIYTLSYILTGLLKEKGLEPSVVAGHSLGEYSALAAAEVLSFEEGLKLVRKRGQLMKNSCPAGQGAMAAVIGMDAIQLEEICQQSNGVCEIANYNSPQQIVISGEKNVVQSVLNDAEKSGAKKVVLLDVSGPFHSSLMEDAKEQFKPIVANIDVKKPEIPFIANVTANYVNETDEIKRLMLEQLTGSIRWVESIKKMINDEVETFIEVGPGRILKGLMRRIDRSVKAYNVESLENIEKLLEKL